MNRAGGSRSPSLGQLLTQMCFSMLTAIPRSFLPDRKSSSSQSRLRLFARVPSTRDWIALRAIRAWAPQCINCHTSFNRATQGWDHLAGKYVNGSWDEQAWNFSGRCAGIGSPSGQNVRWATGGAHHHFRSRNGFNFGFSRWQRSTAVSSNVCPDVGPHYCCESERLSVVPRQFHCPWLWPRRIEVCGHRPHSELASSLPLSIRAARMACHWMRGSAF